MVTWFMKYFILVFLIIFILASCNSSDSAEENGKNDVVRLYNKNCGICHGENGRKGLAGAKILPNSGLDLNERIAIITYGKGQMMPYKELLSKDEIKAIAEYTMRFK